MSLPANARVWYVARDGKQHGPVVDLEFRQIVDRLLPTDLVWTEGWPEWRSATAVQQPARTPVEVARPPPEVANLSPRTGAAQATPIDAPSPSDEAVATQSSGRLSRYAAVAGILGTIVSGVALFFQLNLGEGPSVADLKAVISRDFKSRFEFTAKQMPGTRDAQNATEILSRLSRASFSKRSCEKAAGKTGYYCVVDINMGDGKVARVRNNFKRDGDAWALADWLLDVQPAD